MKRLETQASGEMFRHPGGTFRDVVVDLSRVVASGCRPAAPPPFAALPSGRACVRNSGAEADHPGKPLSGGPVCQVKKAGVVDARSATPAQAGCSAWSPASGKRCGGFNRRAFVVEHYFASAGRFRRPAACGWRVGSFVMTWRPPGCPGASVEVSGEEGAELRCSRASTAGRTGRSC